jgi:hypothetical protein
MPARIQPNRPYYPRYYLPRGAGQARAAAQPRGGGRGGAKGAFGGAIDTSPTGNVGGDLAKAIFNTIQQNRQNAAANQILNTQTPPRAGALGPVVDPATGQVTGNITPTVGTPPQSGGMGELQMRQEQQKTDLENALQQAKIKAALALAGKRTGGGGGGGDGGGGGGGGGNAARWKTYLGGGGDGGSAAAGKKGGKPAPYEPGSIDPNTDPKADKFQVVQADFDAKYGKGAYAKIAPNLPNATVDDKGNYNITDAKGNPVMTLPADQANYWLSRYNAASVRSGQQPIFTDKFPSANPNSGQPGGTEVNPYKPSNQLEARSLPYNSYFIDPSTGQVGQKLPEAKQPPTGQKTSQVDTGDQGQLAQQSSDTAGGLGLASGSPAPPPVPADLSIGVGLDQTGGAVPDTGSQSLADAIARARAQDQLQGVA